ncbi:MAG: DsrE family protein [Gammaproteobacteria bacterium]|nr:DsrE family protein [Gammaproteobacteria bacterium]MDH5734798.1 DsrE family protein [Gammaproteobacteria bacterium]
MKNSVGNIKHVLATFMLLIISYHVLAEEETLRFPGDPTLHNIVYQFNKADQDYHNAVLFSVSEMVRKYGDNITIVVTVIGPGIHILAKNPLRSVSEHTKQKVKSLAEYGVKFHACGNTMKTLKWTKDDMLPFVEIVNVGVADIMELQENGYSYISL